MKNTLRHFENMNTGELIRAALECAADGRVGHARAALLNASDHNDSAWKWAGRTDSTWSRFYRLIMNVGESFGMSPFEFMD